MGGAAAVTGKAWRGRSATNSGCDPVFAGMLLAAIACTSACRPPVSHYVKFDSSVLALTHVRTIDGTGQPPKTNPTIVVSSGVIAAVGNAGTVPVPNDARVLDLEGRTVIPGLVGMHDHLFYQMQGGRSWPAQSSFAVLYLASGVTTIRTAGTLDFDGDLSMKRRIDDGKHPGPRIHLSSGYVGAARGAPDPDRIAEAVERWADRGATSVKAYTSLRSAELRAAIDAAHRRGLKVTGHLCAVGFREAAAMGIDNLEHGLLVNTEFYSRRQPDRCPAQEAVLSEMRGLPVTSPAVRETIAVLVARGVAITSTLAIFETFTPSAANDPQIPFVLAPSVRPMFEQFRAEQTNPRWGSTRAWQALLKKEMEFERAFVAAGGLMVAGSDPTGWGGLMAGFGNQRQLELLVDAGFSPAEAVQIASANGARLLGEQNRIGTLTPGRQADMVVIWGDLASNIRFIRNVETVFKAGVGYDPALLVASVEGTVGRENLFGSRRVRVIAVVVATLGLVALVSRLGRRRDRPASART